MNYSFETAVKLTEKIILALKLGKEKKNPETGKTFRAADYWRRTDNSRDALYWFGRAQFGLSYSPQKGGGVIGLAAGNLEGVAFLRAIFGDKVPISLTQKKGQAVLKAVDACSVEAAVKAAKEAIAE